MPTCCVYGEKFPARNIHQSNTLAAPEPISKADSGVFPPDKMADATALKNWLPRAGLRRSIRTSARGLSASRPDLVTGVENSASVRRLRCVGIHYGLTQRLYSPAKPTASAGYQNVAIPGNQRNTRLIACYFRMATRRIFLGILKSNSGLITTSSFQIRGC